MKKLGLAFVSIVAFGCAGSKEPPVEPTPFEIEKPSEATPPKKTEPEGPKEDEKPKEVPSVEPEFKPGMSVAEAVNAVPADLPRLNIEPEALAAPLANVELYAPCELKPSEHFKLEVAIWNGKAVGIDIDLKPKNDAHANCIRGQVEKLSWKERAKSLNTVKFQL